MSSFERVRAADGTGLAVERAGDRGVPLVLLHGIAQSRASFRSVLEGPLARAFRLVAVDLRGHGDSDKPEGADDYARDERLGGDLHAAIDALGLDRPLVLAWSYGGVVVGEYLRRYGGAALGGILFVAAAVKIGKPSRGLLGPAMTAHGRALMSDDAAVYEAAAREFTAGCSATALAPAVLAETLAAMRRVPAHVRRALLSRSEDFLPDIARARSTPMATLHGTADLVVRPALSDAIDDASGNARGVRLEGVGHMPWIESPAAFEASVHALASRRT